MYGDHTGLTKADLIIKRSMDRYLGKEYDYDVMLNIPLLIHIPNTKEDVTQKNFGNRRESRFYADGGGSYGD